MDVNNEIQIAFSNVIYHSDQDFEEEIKEINRRLENLWKGKGIKFINDNNIDGSYLNITLNSFMTEAVIIKKPVH